MARYVVLIFGLLIASLSPLTAAQIDSQQLNTARKAEGIFQVAQEIPAPSRKIRPSKRPARPQGVRPSQSRPPGVISARPQRPIVSRQVEGLARPAYRPGHRPGYVSGSRPGYRPGTVGLRPVYRPGYRPGWRPPPGYAGWRPGWRPRPYYGRYWNPGIGWVAAAAAGIVAIGVLTNIEAEEYNVPPAPSDDMCWFFTDEKRNKGYWAKCPPLADTPPNTPLIPLP